MQQASKLLRFVSRALNENAIKLFSEVKNPKSTSTLKNSTIDEQNDKSNPPNIQASKQEQADPLKVEYTQTQQIDRYSMTPHQYWITQGKGMERPFTGDLWYVKDVGHYECVVCQNKLFIFDHKFQAPTGMASFWNHNKGAVQVVDDAQSIQLNQVNIVGGGEGEQSKDKKRAICNKCKSHLGIVFYDGPPPTFQRFSINSAALKFVPKEWWDNPHNYKNKLNQKKKAIQKSKNQANKQEVKVKPSSIPVSKTESVKKTMAATQKQQ